MLKIVVVGDLHVGHRLALCPPSVEGGDNEGGHQANKVQQGLYAAWLEATRSKWRAPDALVVNGDALDGQGYRNRGTEQWTTNIFTQCRVAVDLLRMWKAKRIYVVRGTGYHVTLSGVPMEEFMARELGAVKGQGQHSHMEQSIVAEGVGIHFAHAIGVSKVFHYKPTPLARAMLLAALNDALEKRGLGTRTSIVVRSHAHYFVHVAFGHTAGFIVPAWQGRTDFVMSKEPHGYVPKIGFLGLEVDGKDWTYECKLWPLYDIQKTVVSILGGRPKGKRTARSGR